MNIKIKCEEVHNKEDYYDVKINTYKQVIDGRFERSELRHMIEVIDNSINVGG